MAKYHLDFAGVYAFGEHAGPGLHRARVESIEIRESSTGNPQAAWNFVVTEGEEEGAPARGTAPLHKALGIIKSWALACGEDPKRLNVKGGLDVEFDDYVGTEVGIEVEDDPNWGKKVSRVFPLETWERYAAAYAKRQEQDTSGVSIGSLFGDSEE